MSVCLNVSQCHASLGYSSVYVSSLVLISRPADALVRKSKKIKLRHVTNTNLHFGGYFVYPGNTGTHSPGLRENRKWLLEEVRCYFRSRPDDKEQNSRDKDAERRSFRARYEQTDRNTG